MASEPLLVRIRGEFREMPGLRLTLAQARRLWHLDLTTCQAALNALINEGYLRRTPDGAFVTRASADLSMRRPVPLAALRRGA
jgi:DNA-binding GntR family transcriptional regulator